MGGLPEGGTGKYMKNNDVLRQDRARNGAEEVQVLSSAPTIPVNCGAERNSSKHLGGYLGGRISRSESAQFLKPCVLKCRMSFLLMNGRRPTGRHTAGQFRYRLGWRTVLDCPRFLSVHCVVSWEAAAAGTLHPHARNNVLQLLLDAG